MRDAPERIWVWYEPEEDDAQWSEWPDDQAFEGYTFMGVYLLTPADATAALDARDKRVREAAEAVNCNLGKPAHHAHGAILTLIEKDKTHE